MFIPHLHQMRDWLGRHPPPPLVMDDAIGKVIGRRVRELERRHTQKNDALTTATTVGGALLN